MPRIIACNETDAIGFEDFIAALDEADCDFEDEDAFAALAPLLKRLANNRDFLGDRIVRELENRCAGQAGTNEYSTQVVMLHRAKNYFIRANFWPSERESLVRMSGTAPFFYGVPHDHNFSFLTVGYFGPGYWSDYYEYDYDTVTGYPGEAVDLRFVKRARLEEGQLMLYRAHRDVHLQWPADRLSVSLNIMESAGAIGWRDQYRFDVERGEIAELLGTMPSETLMQLAAHLGGGAGEGLLTDFAAHHPSDRIRFAAMAARADAEVDDATRLAIASQGCADASAQVRGLCRTYAEALELMEKWCAAPDESEAGAYKGAPIGSERLIGDTERRAP